MRHRLLTAVSLAALAGGAVALAKPQGRGRASCAAAHSHTLAANRSARVYTVGQRVVGCVAGHRTQLGEASGRLRIDQIALAGRFTGFEAITMGVDTSVAVVRVVDLRTSRVRHQESAASPLLRPESFTGVAGLVVDEHGDVAWIGRRSAIGVAPSYEVRKIDRAGPALLDSGAAIDGGSLRLRGATVSWTDGGARRSADLR